MLERPSKLAWLDRLQDANSVNELLSAFDAIVPDLGVEGFALTRGVWPLEPPVVRTQIEAAHQMVHVESDWIVASHSSSHRIVSSPGMIGWVRTKHAAHRCYTPIDAGQISRAAMEHAVTIPTRTPEGRDGLVALLVPDGVPSGRDMIGLAMLAATLHVRVDRLDMRARCVAMLSAREHDVIAWLAEGKSSDDVADIMGISSATVMFHYRNVAQKFGTLNRTHTVVEAFRRGELRLRGAPIEAGRAPMPGESYAI